MPAIQVGYERDMAENRIKQASNLYGGLINGESICAGYSEILRNVLAEVGIDSIYMSGKGDKGSHAWNQVYLDGRWYNCDLTNDADFILEGLKLPHFLKSNNEFTRLEKYPKHNKEKMHDAKESISDEMQEQLIEEQRANINKEKEKENENMKSENKSFLPRLKNFFDQTKINIKEMLNIFTKKKDIEMEDR